MDTEHQLKAEVRDAQFAVTSGRLSIACERLGKWLMRGLFVAAAVIGPVAEIHAAITHEGSSEMVAIGEATAVGLGITAVGAWMAGSTEARWQRELVQDQAKLTALQAQVEQQT
jgi:hypothetical protein